MKQAKRSDAALPNQLLRQMIVDIFEREDRNGDFVISHDEFSGPKHDEF